MSTIQRVNFEPLSDLLKTQIRDYALADKTIADPLNALAFVDGEWFTIDTNNKAARAASVAGAGNVATQTSYPIFAERGRSDVLAMSGRKVPLIVMGQWEADTRIFDAAVALSGGAAITFVGQPLKVASINIGGKIVTGVVGAVAADGEPIVGRVSRLPANNGGKLRMFGGVSSI
jgi:hypothetical protein